MLKLKQLAAAAFAAVCLTVCVVSTLALGVELAAAQSVVSSVAPDATLSVGNIWTQIQPGLVDLVLALGLAIVAYVASLIKKRTGIDIEAQVRSIEANHRDALHSAVATALGAAISRFGLDKLDFTPTSPVGQFIVQLVNRSVPEAVKVLGAGEQWILTAAQSKLATGNVALPSKTPAP